MQIPSEVVLGRPSYLFGTDQRDHPAFDESAEVICALGELKV
jgi:hypothetical protein